MGKPLRQREPNPFAHRNIENNVVPALGRTFCPRDLALVAQPLIPKGEPNPFAHRNIEKMTNFLVLNVRGFPFRGQGLRNEGCATSQRIPAVSSLPQLPPNPTHHPLN